MGVFEAEYMAASHCGQEIVYIRAIIRDFGVPQSEPTEIYIRTILRA
jgi:hypothetical protein